VVLTPPVVLLQCVPVQFSVLSACNLQPEADDCVPHFVPAGGKGQGSITIVGEYWGFESGSNPALDEVVADAGPVVPQSPEDDSNPVGRPRL